MKPYAHAKSSAHKFGGNLDDYLVYHNWMDQTKAHIADVRHRALLHNAFGIFLLEQQFGVYFTNSVGKVVQVRDVGEQHVLEDLGRIPSLDECFKNLPMEAWFGGPVRAKKLIRLEDIKAIADKHNTNSSKNEDAKLLLGIED
jgi:hypothetical protein